MPHPCAASVCACRHQAICCYRRCARRRSVGPRARFKSGSPARQHARSMILPTHVPTCLRSSVDVNVLCCPESHLCRSSALPVGSASTHPFESCDSGAGRRRAEQRKGELGACSVHGEHSGVGFGDKKMATPRAVACTRSCCRCWGVAYEYLFAVHSVARCVSQKPDIGALTLKAQ
eukprot:5620660-Pleurochrysis_carterae.AAC.1